MESSQPHPLRSHRVAVACPVNDEEHAHIVHGDATDCCPGVVLHHDPMRSLPPQLQWLSIRFSKRHRLIASYSAHLNRCCISVHNVLLSWNAVLVTVLSVQSLFYCLSHREQHLSDLQKFTFC